MNLKLDHVFILVEPKAQVADRLLELGFQEGPRNTPGTANRRIYFANGMVEFLWVRDANEANTGLGKDLRFPEQSLSTLRTIALSYQILLNLSLASLYDVSLLVNGIGHKIHKCLDSNG